MGVHRVWSQVELILLPCFGLSCAGLAGLWWGWSRARTYVRPERFRVGLVLVAVGCTCIWLMPVIFLLVAKRWGAELQGLLGLFGLAIGGGILGGGADMIRRANTRPEHDFWDRL
jgi:hypothetical protein